MNDKLNQLPEPFQKELLYNKLNVYDICETLRNHPDMLTDTIRLNKYMAVRRFNPFKPLFVFQYTLPHKINDVYVDEKIKIQRVEFNFMDCLEIMRDQFADKIKEAEGYPEFSEGEPVIYQCGNRFELGIVRSVCGGDEYFVNYHTGETAARTHARNLHKIENGYAFYVERRRA